MDVFLLAAMGELHMRTTYDLKHGAASEPGSIRDSLARLESQGFLVREGGEDRGWRSMELTEQGTKHLREQWAEGLNPDKEIESVVRSAAVAMTMANALAAATFLRNAASRCERLTGPTEPNAAHLREGLIEFHADAREIYEWRKRAFEAEFLHERASGLIDDSVGEEVASRVSRKKQS